MDKKKIAGFIVILLLLIIYLFINFPKYREPEVAGLVIDFRTGTTEPEVKAIVENCNIPVNYTIDYNTTFFTDENEGKCIYCYIQFVDGSDNRIKNNIKEKDAIRIKNAFETNKKVLSVYIEYFKY
jgi:hypothetical protein